MAKPVSVSELAYFCSDPDGYAKRKGRAWNPAAAKAGTRHHDRAGRPGLFVPLITALALAAAAAYLVTQWL